jgi:biopolymer transport protein ExbD
MRKKAKEELPGINTTALIDVVFMLIIFFIITAKMQEVTLNEAIKMAMSPHGKTEDRIDPRRIMVDVDSKGGIYINRSHLEPPMFKSIVAKAVAEYGTETPIVIVGDVKTQHKYIRKVMDACTECGIWKLKFMALKEGG